MWYLFPLKLQNKLPSYIEIVILEIHDSLLAAGINNYIPLKWYVQIILFIYQY